MAASRALMGGDWRQAYEHVESLTVWSLLAGKEDRLNLMRNKLQECGLRTYLFASGSYYQSLSLEQLCQMFELPEERVRCSETDLLLPSPLPLSRGVWVIMWCRTGMRMAVGAITCWTCRCHHIKILSSHPVSEMTGGLEKLQVLQCDLQGPHLNGLFNR